jgi:hypothetical protein
MDTELLDEVRKSVQKQGHVEELQADLTNSVLTSVGSKFVKEPKSIWWWQNLNCPAQTLSYANADMANEIRELLPDDQQVRLVITDDEPPPWPVFQGPVDEVLAVIGEQRFCEFFLIPVTNAEPGWIIFDTHDNQLVVAGEIPSS